MKREEKKTNYLQLNQSEYENENTIKFTRTILPYYTCYIGQYSAMQKD